MSLHREDRELQIRLAELQADVQIYVTVCFGVTAGNIAFLLYCLQTLKSIPPEDTLRIGFSLFSIVLIAGLLFFSTGYFLIKALNSRKQMEELRKRYVW